MSKFKDKSKAFADNRDSMLDGSRAGKKTDVQKGGAGKSQGGVKSKFQQDAKVITEKNTPTPPKTKTDKPAPKPKGPKL